MSKLEEMIKERDKVQKKLRELNHEIYEEILKKTKKGASHDDNTKSD